MCGIAGVVGLTERETARRNVKKMTDALARRGPDSGGIESWHGAVLGHRRLAIFDLSQAGSQPMLSADRLVGIVFNGAVYNYRELRKELMAHGCVFVSNTDTEVLIHGYREWGIDRLVSRLRGMFAFGLWDERNHRLYLVRDRLGVKPLVFVLSNGTIAFASTVRALRLAGYVSDLNESAVLEFLARGYISEDHSVYRGAHKVPPGSIVEWAEGVLKTRRYWLPPSVAESPPSFSEAVEQTEHLLLQAVELRLHADVPVGALLSGGVDSSLVCWALAKLGSDVTAYTIGTPGDPWDETADAVRTAKALGIRHSVLQMSPQDSPGAGELVSAFAEPFASPSALGMLRVSRAVAPSAKVLLTGDGGDDVFLGYPRHRHLWVAGQLSQVLPQVVQKYWLTTRKAFPRIGPLRRAAALFDYAAGDLRAFGGDYNGLSGDGPRDLLGDRLLSAGHNQSYVALARNNGRGILAGYLEYEHRTQFVSEYLTKVDGATMHFGLEARSPFLDQFIWEYACSLPVSLRLHRGRLKAILRELARRRIGPAVAKRSKTGFRIPVQRWIVKHWRPEVEATLRDSLLDREGWIRRASGLAHLESAVHKGRAPDMLWHIFVLESWVRDERLRSQELSPALKTG
jgi:asparagine synthase (glutamine-hydrolysing)